MALDLKYDPNWKPSKGADELDLTYDPGWKAPTPTPKGFMGHARDLGISALQSAIGVPELAVGLADIPTGGAVGKALENKDGAFGFRPKQARDYLDTLRTEAGQQQQREFEQADGITGKAAYALQNPSLIANTVVGSLGPMVAGGGIGRGLMAVAPRLGAVAAGAIGEGVAGAGSLAENVRQKTADGTLTPTQAGLSAAAGAAMAGFGFAGGKVAQRLGIADADTLMVQGAKGLTGQAAQQAAVKGIPRKVIEGAIAEGFLEELPQSVSEQVLQNIALNKDWSEGVDSAVVLGVLSGMAMGGGAAGLQGASQSRAAAGAPQETPASTPAPANPSPFDSTAQPPILNEQALEQAGVMPPPVLDADRINQAVDLEAGAPLPFAPTPAEELATMRKTAMGIDPAAGPLSAGAAIAVESQAAEEIRLGTAATMAEGAAAADQARLERDAWQAANPGIPFERIGREDYDTLNPVRLGEGELLDPQAGVPATVESGGGSVAERWEQMTPDQRRQIVRQVPGIAEIVSRNLPGAEWGRINPDLQKRISRAVDSGASGSGGNGGGSAGEWSAFPAESGTLNVPRAAMPQIKAEHRGAMVNFMNARGVQHREETVPASSLKPTQAEFSREKVARAKTFEGGSRSILVSADNHVLDGHHQWLAKREAGEDVKVIRLDAPIRDLVGLAHDFPSSTTAGGSASEVVTNPATPVEKSSQNAQIQPETRAATGMAGGGQNGEQGASIRDGAGGQYAAGRAAASADDLRAMAQDAGWQEVGGRLVRSQDGTVSRTKWLPRADWFMAGMESDSAKLSQDIARLVAGQRVPAKSRRTIEGMMDWLDAQRGTAAPNEDASAYDFEAAGMGVDASEDALMIGDIFAEVGAQDDAATMRALGFTEQEIQDAVGQQADRAGQGGARQADAGRAPEAGEVAQGDARAQGEARGEGGQAEGLTSYTNADIARQEAEQKARSEADAAAQRAADQKTQADAERGSFTLTGSDRAADVMAAQGQGGLFEATQEAGTGYTVEERKKAKRDDYTQDLFGNSVPDTLGGAGVGQQSASAENRNLLAASSVPGAVFATVTGARQTGELKTAFPVVDTASKAAHTFAGLRKRTTEHFAVLVLNAKGEPIAYSEMFSGGTSATSVYPDAVAKFVYGIPGAASFWISHNHPSGSPTPSNADVQLTKVLSKAYGQGTGIEMAGHVVIAGSKASLIAIDGAIEEQGFAIPAMPRRNTIPIMRRDILRLDTFSDSIASPAAAKVAVRVLSGKESGVVFLNAQNAPVAFLPMSQATMVRLRDGKSARELFGAAARSNASAAMIHLGAQHSRAELEAASQNLHDALSGAGDIRILDAFLDEGDKMYSLAESGEISGSGRGVFMSRAEPRSAAPKTITAESLPGIFAERFPKLSSAIRTMLDRGALGQKGGLVVLDSNDEAQIAREFADRTGRSFDDTVQMFAGAGEDINAFYDPESGLTFMVGPNLSAESLPAVVLHEMVHGQQRQALDQKALALIDGRDKQAPALRAFLDRVAERMEAVGETGNPFEATSYIVEMAVQEGRQSGFSRADGPILAWIEHNIGRKVADLVRDFVAMARAWALSHGVTLKSIAVDDLVAYAMAGVGKAARGRVVTNEGTSSLSQRQRVSPENLPDAFVANPLGAAAGPDHDAAKAGDREAALRLARRLVTPELLEHVRRVAPKDAVVLGVASVEATGRNALPETAATLIAQRLGLDLDPGILQANRPKRTAMDGLDRVFGQAEFDGPIEPGKSYVLVDDTLTQGGTFAALASHIEQNGGRVAAVVALTGKQYSSRLSPDSSLIQQLRNTHGDVESSFERATGYGFDGLTASEARYLANFKPADAVRARILAAVEAGDPGLGDGAAGPRFSRRGNDEGLTAPPQGDSRSRGPVRQARPAASIAAAWEAPEPSKLFGGRIDKDSLIYTLQNKQIDMKRVVDAIAAKIGQIADDWNPYLQEELFHGRSAKGVKDFLTKEMRPLITRMRLNRVEMGEFERFLHARHAKEANDHIAKINPGNPEFQDGGSGMTNQEARDIMAALSPERRKALDSLAAQVDAINTNTRKLLVASGLETAETVKAWEAAYKHYVPLQREDAESGGLGIGQGFSVRGSAAKRRTGSTRAVVDILANIAMQRERTIVRAEKNRVAQALYALSLKAPNPDFWMPINPDEAKAMKPAERQKIAGELVALGLDPADAQNFVKEPVERYVNPATGLVAERINPTLRNRDNVLAVRVNGKDRFVFFNQRDERAQRMAGALKNLDADQLGRMLQVSAKVTRWFAAVNTQYNPIFGIVNALRDGQSALLQLSTTPIRGDEAKVLAGAVPAMKGIYAGLRRERAGAAAPSGEWSKLWEDFQQNGGQTGFRDQFANSQDRADALRRELDPTVWADGPLAKIFKADGALRVPLGIAQKRAAGLFGWLSDYNDMMENGFRLSAYKAALDRGMSKQQAASIAKNLTVNFNRKGQVASQAGALYAFFNASMQGTARLWQTLNGPLGRKIIGGGLALGVLQALMLAAAGFGDDDPPEFVRERSIVIPLADGKYASIPMPLGYHVIPSFSRITTEWALGGFKDTAKRFGDILGLLADTFNPIGNAGISVQTIAPTAVDPLVALAENRDYTGKPIAQQDFNGLSPTPGHTRAKDTASGLSKAIAYWANLASGGTNYKPGLISPTPDQLDYLIGQITGGVGREYLKGEQTVSSLFSGEELPTHKIPLLGRFYGDTQGQSSEGARYYANLKEIHLHRAEIEGRRKDGGDVAGYLAENPAARLGMAGPLKVEGEVRKLRESKRDALEKGQTVRVKMIDARITALMKQFNERVAGLEGV